jgi:predicted ribonuclease YlaK
VDINSSSTFLNPLDSLNTSNTLNKHYFLDTNIILDNVENLITLSDNGENAIILCRTVLSELDSKKTLEGSVGYNAREFFRLMEKAELIGKSDLNSHAKRVLLKYTTEGGVGIHIHLVSLINHEITEKNTDPKRLNDAKIIETAQKIIADYENFVVLSNDIAFRSDAILDDLDCESFKTDNKKVSELNFFRSFNATSDGSNGSFVLPCTMEAVQELANLTEDTDINSLCGIEVIFDNGNRCYGYKQGNLFFEVLDEDLQKQIIKPINTRQKVLSSLILSDTNDVVVCTSKAGGGKNLVATSAACALMDRKQSPYEGIVYIRSNIDSIEDKDQEFGFLPGPQPLWAKVLTPVGWTTMGELKEGDYVIGKDGLPHKILQTFDKGIKDVYRIDTTTGKVGYSCEDHLWSTQNFNEHRHMKPFKIRTLREIKETLHYQTGVEGSRHNGKLSHHLPKNEAVEFTKQNLSIPPYTLGCLLGDGSFSSVNRSVVFSSTDKEIIDRVEEELNSIGAKLSYNGGVNYCVTNILETPIKVSQVTIAHKDDIVLEFEHKHQCLEYFGISANQLDELSNNSKCFNGWYFERFESDDISTNIVKNELYKLGLLGTKSNTKFIPNNYLYSNKQDRLDLLRGLMDTDGHAHISRGSATFSTISEILAENISELIYSLGGTLYINKRKELREHIWDGRLISSNYHEIEVGVTLYNENPFHLYRKAIRYNANKGGMRKAVKQDIISSIEKYSTEPVKCILLDSEDHLYITNDYLVTHNTLDAKMGPYLRPLKDTVETLVREKYKVAFSKERTKDRNKDDDSTGELNKSLIEVKTEEFMQKYNITYEALNFLRGGTIKNRVVIIDEGQNMSVSAFKLVLTRIGENCTVLVLGDVGQIDSKYMNERNNGLTHMMNLIGTEQDIRIVGLDFNKTIRSKIAGWAADNL